MYNQNTMSIEELTLIENKGITFSLDGFTVKAGSFYGHVRLSTGDEYACAWSGWTSNHSIGLYILEPNKPPILYWVDGDDVESCVVDTSRDFWQEYCQECERREYEAGDCYASEHLYKQVPWFAL